MVHTVQTRKPQLPSERRFECLQMRGHRIQRHALTRLRIGYDIFEPGDSVVKGLAGVGAGGLHRCIPTSGVVGKDVWGRGGDAVEEELEVVSRVPEVFPYQ